MNNYTFEVLHNVIQVTCSLIRISISAASFFMYEKGDNVTMK